MSIEAVTLLWKEKQSAFGIDSQSSFAFQNEMRSSNSSYIVEVQFVSRVSLKLSLTDYGSIMKHVS